QSATRKPFKPLQMPKLPITKSKLPRHDQPSDIATISKETTEPKQTKQTKQPAQLQPPAKLKKTKIPSGSKRAPGLSTKKTKKSSKAGIHTLSSTGIMKSVCRLCASSTSIY